MTHATSFWCCHPSYESNLKFRIWYTGQLIRKGLYINFLIMIIYHRLPIWSTVILFQEFCGIFLILTANFADKYYAFCIFIFEKQLEINLLESLYNLISYHSLTTLTILLCLISPLVWDSFARKSRCGTNGSPPRFHVEACYTT